MAKCRHKLPYYLNNYHGLQLPVLHPPDPGPPEQGPPDQGPHEQGPPDQGPPDSEVLDREADEEISQPQPQDRGPMTRSRHRQQQISQL